MASGASDHGDRGQEEAWLVAEREGATLCVVARGLGSGGWSGLPAAAETIATVRAAFDAGAPVDVVLTSLRSANREIRARSAAWTRRAPGSDPRGGAVGATAEITLFSGGRAHLAHVGDGCTYRLRDGELRPLTVPHSLRNDYRRARPDIDEDELANVPPNVVVRALGMCDDLEIDVDDVSARAGDVWLLCSRGLTTLVSDERIAFILAGGGAPDVMARALVDAALATCASGDYKDNITAVAHVVELR